MGIGWEWTWECPGNMGIGLGLPWAGTGSSWQGCIGRACLGENPQRGTLRRLFMRLVLQLLRAGPGLLG